MTASVNSACFHCGLPVPRGVDIAVEIDGDTRAMCCPGCAAVASWILDQGMEEYYRRREGPAPTMERELDEIVEEHRVYDDPALQEGFVRRTADDSATASLAVEGITCAACVWLIEAQLARLDGVVKAHVNLAQRRAVVEWNPAELRISEVMSAIDRLGYRASPYEVDRSEEMLRREERSALRRLGVAGIGMAQVMMFAVALYAGAIEGMAEPYRDLLRGVSLLVATGVIVYAARPFFAGALRELRSRRIGMDVPVALALGSAYLASGFATFTGTGDVYFDSICMFTFFLSLARTLELKARSRSSTFVRSLARRATKVARRIVGAEEESVPAGALVCGDLVRVAPGETLPGDGVVIEGESAVSEALLTGESAPRGVAPGDHVLAGSQNVDGSLVLEIDRVGGESTLASILRLLDRAASEKPRLAEQADRVARAFVTAILIGAAMVALTWWWISPQDAFWITLSVLIATCPCALSLATPAALAAATNGLATRGFLITRPHALETLAKVDHAVFDKTGTLTRDRPTLESVVPIGSRDVTEIMAIAKLLERSSNHPYARAIAAAALSRSETIDALVERLAPLAESLEVVPNRGVQGRLADERYRLGDPEWVADALGVPPLDPPNRKQSWLLLADSRTPIAWLGLQTELREDATEVIASLRALGIECHLLSGDPSVHEVRRVAESLGIDSWLAASLPEDKLAALEALQAQGGIVAAIGDGTNDAPLLGRAHVSIAMGSGTDLARVSSDAVLLGANLEPLADAFEKARATRRIVRQNLGWALAYNFSVLPLAAFGLVAPHWAAIGMSLSSIGVVMNALRLNGRRSAG